MHGASRKQTDRCLSGQHDRVHAGVHGVCGVTDLGPRGPSLGRHRLEHLRRQDDRNAVMPRPARDFLLRARHAFERHLEAEIAPGDHDRVTCLNNLFEMVQRLRPLELRHERDVGPSVVGHQLPCLSQIRGALDEADRDHVHAGSQSELQVVHVF